MEIKDFLLQVERTIDLILSGELSCPYLLIEFDETSSTLLRQNNGEEVIIVGEDLTFPLQSVKKIIEQYPGIEISELMDLFATRFDPLLACIEAENNYTLNGLINIFKSFNTCKKLTEQIPDDFQEEKDHIKTILAKFQEFFDKWPENTRETVDAMMALHCNE